MVNFTKKDRYWQFGRLGACIRLLFQPFAQKIYAENLRRKSLFGAVVKLGLVIAVKIAIFC